MDKDDRILIDVLSDESYEREHARGARHFCVYETAFCEKIREAFPDKTTPLSICGYCDDTRESEIAVERLKAEGYEDVSVVEGGLERWKKRGGEIEGTGEKEEPADGRREVIADDSFIRWTGRNLFNFHTGEVRLKEGFVTLKGGGLAGGEFRVDLESMSCSDLTDSKLNRMLIDHLRSDDFFDVENHPVASFEVSAAEPVEGASAGMPNYRIKGELTLRGKRHPLEFDALVAWKEDGICVAQAVLDIDRTVWGSIYGSGKFFARLGQHVVNDLVHLHVKVAVSAGGVG